MATLTNTGSIILDRVKPTLAISSNTSSLKAGQTARLTFTLSEISTNFVLGDILVSGGTLSNFTGSGTSYSATFTPKANSIAAASIRVASGVFSDAAGNRNADGFDANNRFAIAVSTVTPTIAISKNVSSLKAGQTAKLTFTLSEASTDFVVGDVTVNGGSLSNFTGIGRNYSATFTPTSNSSTVASISVASAKFSNAAGNLNTDGSEANNKLTIAVSTLAPTIAISSNTSSLKAGQTAIINFTLSEASTNFTLGDIMVSGGSLSNFYGSGRSYSATFKPSGTTGSISVASAKFSNAARNLNADGQEANNTLAITMDTVAPTIALSSNLSSVKAGQTATINFTLSEACTDFTIGDIVVTGGTLSGLSGAGLTRTATFTPTINSGTAARISVASGKFNDAAGNQNTDGSEANNTLAILVSTVVPTIAISSNASKLKAGETANITFTLSEASADFASGDVTVSGGSLSNFTGSGSSYSATFTPSGTAASISVTSGKFSNAAGNQNADNTLVIAVDTVAPTIVLGSNAARLMPGQTANITFTLSEASTDFVLGDVTVNGGSLSNFTGSGRYYSATFTPDTNSSIAARISVASGQFKDAAGNLNADGIDTNNTLTILVSTVVPTIAITSNASNLKAGETAFITFTLSEASTDFVLADVTVNGGSLSSFAGSGSSYSATFTPSGTTGNISVASAKFSNAAGNLNADGLEADTTLVITVGPVAPTIALSSNLSSVKVGETAIISFTLSEASTNFAADDVTYSGGSLSNFKGSGKEYSATFTPTSNSSTAAHISVASGKFSDAAGKPNTDGNEANNTLAILMNTVVPTLAITSNASSLKADDTAIITFTLSEASTDFVLEDVTVNGGSLSNFTGSGSSYSATFTPSDTAASISVVSAKFSNAAGNLNADGLEANNKLVITVDTVAPTIAIESNVSTLMAGNTGKLTFTLSEASANFAADDVTFSGGSLSDFKGSGTDYSATFTPDTNSLIAARISVASGQFDDAAGNLNADGQEADNMLAIAVNTVTPTISISTAVSRLKVGQTASIHFWLSDSKNNFSAADIDVHGGTLSPLSGSGIHYSATFKPTANSSLAASISVASKMFSNAAGNENTDGLDPNNTLTFAVDTLVPNIVISSSPSILKAGQTAAISFVLSENSSNFSAGDVTVAGGVLTQFTGSGHNYSATFTPTRNSTTEASISVISGKFSDAAGNLNAVGSIVTMEVDTLAPTVSGLGITSATGALASTLNAGDVVTATVTFSEAVTVTGTPQLALNLGGTTVQANYLSGSGSSALTFHYTILAGQNDTDGISLAANALGLNNGTIMDAAGNNATLTHGLVESNHSYLVDTTAPTLDISGSVTTLNQDATAAITFTFSEDPGDTFAWDGTLGDIVVTGGTLSAIIGNDLSGSDFTRTATFTLNSDGATSAAILVLENSYTDAAGNSGIGVELVLVGVTP